MADLVAALEFRILGPVEVLADGRPLPLGGTKQRALLAVLLLHANHVVSSDRLIDELWGEAPPDTVTQGLRVHVSQLRKVLEREHLPGEENEVLVTRAPGYMIRLGTDQLDLHRFERLLADAREALAAGDPARSSARFRDALALWRGPPLADLASESFAQTDIARLEELRLTALEERIDADLGLGLQADLVGELESLVARHPLRERVRAQLMLALYRAGRQAEALEVYQATRRTLVEELGIEPSPALQRLEKAILLQDPALEAGLAAAGKVEDEDMSLPHRPLAAPRRLLRPVVLALGGIVAAAAAVSALVLARSDEGRLEAVGVVRANTAVQIDPATNRVVREIAVGTSPSLVAASRDAVWVANFDDKTLSRIDPAGGREVKRIAAGGAPTGLAAGVGAVWVTHSYDGTLSRVDPATDDVVATVKLGSGVKDVAVGEGAVWVADGLDGTVLRIDPETNELAATIDVGGSPAGLAAGAGAIWVADGKALLRIDPAANKVVARIALRYEANRVAIGSGAVWVTSYLGDTVMRVDTATNSATAAIPVGDGPAGVAVGPDSVWVTNSLAGNVSRVDPRTNSVVSTVQVGYVPAGVAADGQGVWVAVQPR